MNAGNRASINAIGNPFTGIRYNRVRHSVLKILELNSLNKPSKLHWFKV